MCTRFKKKVENRCSRSLYLVYVLTLPLTHFLAMPSLDWNQANYSDKIILNSKPTSNDLAKLFSQVYLSIFLRWFVRSQKIPNLYFIFSWIIHHLFLVYLDCNASELFHDSFFFISHFLRERCFSLACEYTCQRAAFSDKNNRLICSSRQRLQSPENKTLHYKKLQRTQWN